MAAPSFLKQPPPFGSVTVPSTFSLPHINLLLTINAWFARWDAPGNAIEAAFNAATPAQQSAAIASYRLFINGVLTFEREETVQGYLDATYAALGS